MSGVAMPPVKTCCISRINDARVAVQHGASAVGLVSETPSRPSVIGESSVAQIVAAIPAGVASVLLTSKPSAADIVDQQRRVRVNAAQICDHVRDGTYADLRCALPGVSLRQVAYHASRVVGSLTLWMRWRGPSWQALARGA